MTKCRFAPKTGSLHHFGHAVLIALCAAFVCSSSGCNSPKKSGENLGEKTSADKASDQADDKSKEIVLGHFASMTGSEWKSSRRWPLKATLATAAIDMPWWWA